MIITQSSHDRYSAALIDYEKIALERQTGWEAYSEEAIKIRKFLSSATIEEEVIRVLGNEYSIPNLDEV